MNDVLKFGKKIFTVGVVMTTILWSLGVAALVPGVASAATCPTLNAGDMVKVTGKPAIYVLNNNLEVLYFPDGDVFKSYTADNKYTGYKTISDECYNSLKLPKMNPSGANYRAGTYVVKRPSSDQLYVVEPGNTLATITPAAAKALYGTGYKVVTIADNFWPNYVNSGSPVTEAVAHPGMLVSNGGKTWYVTAGKKQEVTATGMTANRFQSKFVHAATDAMLAGLTTGDAITAEVASLTDRTQSGGVTTTPVVTGSVTVALSANSPAGTSLPDAATHVPFTTFTVKSDNAGSLYAVSLKRVGFGDYRNISKVWLEVGGVPVSNAQAVNSDDTLNVTLTNFNMTAGTPVEFTVVGNLANRSGMTSQEDAFQVVSLDLGKGVSVSGLPVTGSRMTYRDYSPGTATLADKGSATTVKVGDNTVVGEFDVAWDSTTDKDGAFKYVRFRNVGTAKLADLSNVLLTENDVTVSASTEVSGDYVTFKLLDDKQTLADGKTRHFAIKAEIKDGDASANYIFVLKDARDIYVKDADTGYGAAINMDDVDANSVTASGYLKTYTLDAGQLTVSKDDSNPNNVNVSKNTKNVTALVAKVDLGQKVTVDGVKIYFNSDSSEAASSGSDESANIALDIEKAYLYVNDNKIQTVSAVSGSGNDNGTIANREYYYDFDSSFTLKDNDLVKLVIDFKKDAVPTNKYKFTFNATDFVTPEYTASGNSVADGAKSGTATGNLVTITASSYTWTRNDGYTTNETFTVGSKQVKLMQVLMSGGSSSDVTIKNLNFDMSATSLYSYFTNLYVTVNGVKFDQSKDMNSSGSVTFTNLNKTIAKNGQATIALYTDVQTGLTSGSTSTFTLDDSESLVEDSESGTVNYSDVTSPDLQFLGAGTLTLSLDGDTAETAMVPAGKTTPVDLGTWKLVDKYGDLEVTDLYFANTDGTSVVTTADFLVSEYRLVARKAGVADVAIATAKAPTAGKVHFEMDTTPFAIAKDQTARVVLQAVLNPINNQANTGKKFIASLYGVEVRAKGGASLTSVVGDNVALEDSYNNSTAIDANAIVAYATVPTLKTAAINSTLANAPIDVYNFSVGADPSGDVSWKVINLDASGLCTGGAIGACLGPTSSMKLKLGTKQINATFTTSTSGGLYNVKIVLDGVETVAAGSAKIYTLEASLTGFTGDNDSLSFRIKDNNSAFATPAAYSSVSQTDGFIWADNSGDDADTSVAQWMDGYKTLGLDTSVSTLKR